MQELSHSLLAQVGLSADISPLIYLSIFIGLGALGSFLGILGLISTYSKINRKVESLCVSILGILAWCVAIAIWVDRSFSSVTGLALLLLGVTPNIWAITHAFATRRAIKPAESEAA